MKTVNTSNTPQTEAGIYITQLLREPRTENILLLLSGGSAFSVLDHINPDILGQHLSIVMADERFSREPEENNFLQLQGTDFYKKAVAAGVTFIESVPEEYEAHDAFAKRIAKQIEAVFANGTKMYTLGLFGVGNDGHTASIFPSSKSDFEQKYKNESLYVGVTVENDIPLRATVTPYFIQEYVDDVVIYAKGKQEILTMAFNHNEVSDMPAKIILDHYRSSLFTDVELPVV